MNGAPYKVIDIKNRGKGFVVRNYRVNVWSKSMWIAPKYDRILDCIQIALRSRERIGILLLVVSLQQGTPSEKRLVVHL
jgi:hypothetical protein